MMLWSDRPLQRLGPSVLKIAAKIAGFLLLAALGAQHMILSLADRGMIERTAAPH